MHASLFDHRVWAIQRAKISSGVFPWGFFVGQIAEPLSSLFAIDLKNLVDGISRIVIEVFRITFGKHRLIDQKLASMNLVDRWQHRPVCPSFKICVEKCALIPNHGPGLLVINEFLELHCRYFASFIKDVAGNIMLCGFGHFIRSQIDFLKYIWIIKILQWCVVMRDSDSMKTI